MYSNNPHTLNKLKQSIKEAISSRDFKFVYEQKGDILNIYCDD
jgi:hypothetical protein